VKSLLTAALLAAMLATPAFAADTTKPESPSAKDAADKKAAEEKLVCTREAQVGSIITKKVCRTAAQIEAEREAARKVDEERQRQSLRGDSQLLR
jgi:opacity protein-like surface antigen